MYETYIYSLCIIISHKERSSCPLKCRYVTIDGVLLVSNSIIQGLLDVLGVVMLGWL